MRNVDEIKRLEGELGRYKKMVADRDKQIKKLNGYNEAVEELRKALDAYMIQMCLRFGFTEEVGGALYEHCLTLPKNNIQETLDKYKLELYAGEKEDEIIMQAVERESRTD